MAAIPSSTDAFGRATLAAVWPTVLGETPSALELQAVQAVSRGEGLYGRATYKLLSIPDGALIATVNDSNNWGAVQAGHPPCDPASSFVATDSSPRLQNAENPKGYYNICFRRHATPEEGAANYLRTLLVHHGRSVVRTAVRTGSAQAIAQAMHDTGYYEGFGPTVFDRIKRYADGIFKNAGDIAANLKEPRLVTRNHGAAAATTGRVSANAIAVGLGVAVGALLLWKGTS